MSKLIGELVTLKLLDQELIENYLPVFSPLIQQMLAVDSVQEERIYLLQQLEKQKKGLTFFYCILNNETSEVIGAIEIRETPQHSGQLYCWLHEDFWGKGFFQEAMQLIAREYFKNTGRNFFNAHVDIENERSYFALKKFGFADLGFVKGPRGPQYELILRKK